MVFYPGRKLCGEIVIADIGFPAYTKYEGHTYFAYDPEDQNQIPKRRADANKGTYGKILIAAGSEGMCGAAYLSALAAYPDGRGTCEDPDRPGKCADSAKSPSGGDPDAV